MTNPISKENAKYNKDKSFTVVNSKEYAITITPNPRLYDTCNTVKQYQRMKDDIYKHYRHIASRLVLYPELSKQGNIHFHGLIEIKDYVKFYKMLKKHNTCIGFRLVKELTDPVVWLEYCVKDRLLMQTILNRSLPDTISSHNEEKYQQKLSNNIGTILTPDVLKYLR